MFNCIVCKFNKLSFITNLGYKFTSEKVVFCPECNLLQLNKSTVRKSNSYYKSGKFNEEIRKFKYLSKENAKISILKAQKRYKKLTKIINITQIKKVLEIGCGFGPMLNILKTKHNIKIQGVEPSLGMKENAKKYFNINIANKSYSEDKFNKKKFDLIIIYQVIEHIINLNSFLKQLKKNSNKRTLILIEFPDIYQALKNRKIIGKHYFQKSHLYDFDPYSLNKIFVRHGFSCIGYWPSNEKRPNDKNSTILFQFDAKKKLNINLPRINFLNYFFQIKFPHFVFKKFS